jgi:hypothetical protein
MSIMKDSGEPSFEERGQRSRPRRRSAGPTDSNQAFLQAFADALRDILRDEHRAAMA